MTALLAACQTFLLHINWKGMGCACRCLEISLLMFYHLLILVLCLLMLFVQLLVSVGLEDYHLIAVWDWRKGRVLATVRGHTDRVSSKIIIMQ